MGNLDFFSFSTYFIKIKTKNIIYIYGEEFISAIKNNKNKKTLNKKVKNTLDRRDEGFRDQD